jgi:glycosyltransferase involved in cell wall biosynthesis
MTSSGQPPKRIVFAVPEFEPAVGGTARQVGLQARELARRGHPVTIVTRRMRPEWPAFERLDAIELHRVGPPGYARRQVKLGALTLARWAARHRDQIGIYQPVMWLDALYGAGAARLLGRTLNIWAIRGDAAVAVRPGASMPRRAQGAIRRTLLDRCAHLVLTESMAAELRELDVGGEIAVIPVPVDLTRFRPPVDGERSAARAALGLHDEAFTVAYVGHLQERKAVDRLIEAFRRLREEGATAARLLIVGGSRGAPDDTEPQLRAQVAAAHLEDAVTFCGVTAEPRRVLWAADALVLPSFREGLPNSLIEAMACGVPCVAPPSAGGHELIRPDTGIVPASNRPAALLGALRQLFEDPAGRARMSAAAAARAGRYEVTAVVDEYERLYARLQADQRDRHGR